MKSTETLHRPIIVKGMDHLISPDEKRKIRNIATKIILLDKEQDKLVSQYRGLVGFNETNIGIHDQVDEMDNWGSVKGWLDFAEAARKRWIIENIGIRAQPTESGTIHCSRCGERITTPTFHEGAVYCGLCAENL